MVTELELVTLQSVAVIVVDPVVPLPVVVPEPLEIAVMIAVFEMFQVTSLVTSVLPLPLKEASAVNAMGVAVLAGTVRGLAVIVRSVTEGQTERLAVAGVSAWKAALMVVVCGGFETVAAAVTNPVFESMVAAAGLLEVQKHLSVMI